MAYNECVADGQRGKVGYHLRAQAVEKRPSTAFCSSLVTAAYALVRLIPRDFARLASGHVESACEHRMFQHAGKEGDPLRRSSDILSHSSLEGADDPSSR